MCLNGKQKLKDVSADVLKMIFHQVEWPVLKNKQYSRLLTEWAKGAAVDWSLLYEGEKPKRVSLPVYPFAKERYWVPVPADIRKQTDEPAENQRSFFKRLEAARSGGI